MKNLCFLIIVEVFKTDLWRIGGWISSNSTCALTFQLYFCQGRLVESGDKIRGISVVLCVLGGRRKKKKKKNVWSVFRSLYLRIWWFWCSITTQIPCSTFSWNRIHLVLRNCWNSTKFSVTCLCDFDCTINCCGHSAILGIIAWHFCQWQTGWWGVALFVMDLLPRVQTKGVAGVEVRDSLTLWLMSLLSLAIYFHDTVIHTVTMCQTRGGKAHTSLKEMAWAGLCQWMLGIVPYQPSLTAVKQFTVFP